jgi:glycosyltransferase involved in cell wall biosynthesis
MPEPAPRPPIASKPLSLVLVAANAGADLEPIITAWMAQLEARQTDFEIIFVDDGSTDETPRLADTLAEGNKKLRIIHHAPAVGFGAALRSGIAAARHPMLATCTGDRQYQPADLKRLLELIDKVDMVAGYRQWLAVPRLLRGLGSLWRTFVRVVFGIPLDPLPCWLGDGGQRKRWLARWLFGVRVHDVECAFRLYRRAIFDRLTIQSRGRFAAVEILAKANFLGCLMTEVGVTYQAATAPAGQQTLDRQHPFLSEAYQVFSDPVFGA